MKPLNNTEKLEMKIAALDRINFLELNDAVKECFVNNTVAIFDFIFGTEANPVIGVRKCTDEELKQIQEIEQSLNIMVYVAIASDTMVGKLLDCLYVSNYPDDRIIESDILKRNLAMSYCINYTEPDFSELGSIEFRNINGCLMRIF